MKWVLKLYSASCVIVFGFFLFFCIPWGLMPFSDGVNVMVVGGFLLASAIVYTQYYRKREAFDFGWFLYYRGGFWVLCLAVLGAVLLLLGSLITFWPGLYMPVIERGALPVGILIVSLFWLALIFMFGYLSFGTVAKTIVHLRSVMISEAFIYSLLGLLCVGMTGVFFSLFLEVLNDIALRISEATQWKAIWIFVGLLIVAGTGQGIREPKIPRSKSASSAREEG